MKPKNFPARKLKRQKAALERFRPDVTSRTGIQKAAARYEEFLRLTELASLAEQVARDVRTKKFGGKTARQAKWR
jgi:hypothetical protein